MRVPELAVPSQLSLSEQELADLEMLADVVIEETLQAYDSYCVHDDRGVDAKRWKLVRHLGGLEVYASRKEFRDTTQKLRTADGLLVPVMARHSIPSTMMVGTLPGRIEDSLYGDFFDSTVAARARLALIKDQFEDMRVVHLIRGPTEDEPFRFCGVVWASLSPSVRPFVQQRDVCLLVSSGLAYTDSGVPFAYNVQHSISLPELRPLNDYKFIRAKMSKCCLKRQLTEDTMEVFERGFFAPMGSTRDASSSKNFAAAMLAVPTQSVDAALTKKLDWMRHHSRGRKRTLVFDQGCAGRCQTRFNANSSGSCVICRSPVCNSCKTIKKIASEPTGEVVKLAPLVFCIVCVTMAQRKSADVFAIREIGGNRFTGATIWSQSDGYSERERRLDMDTYEEANEDVEKEDCSRASQRSSQRSTQKISMS